MNAVWECMAIISPFMCMFFPKKKKFLLMARKDGGVKGKCHFPSIIVLSFMRYTFTFMGRRKKGIEYVLL